MIDIVTLLVLLATADVILAAALAIGTGGSSRDGLSHWTASLAVRALAFGLLAAGAAPQHGAAAGAAGLLALSMTLRALAIASVGLILLRTAPLAQNLAAAHHLCFNKHHQR